MVPVNMLSDINMEFFQALNPLYAVPIVAVIICAFLVYAFGFKSPVPPPSFEGIEEEKKYPKKRRVKENQKKEKLLQNGKANGGTTKGNGSASKKKEAIEKHVEEEKSAAIDKTNAAEKAPVLDKKALKKARKDNEKKLAQEMNDVISHDDFNEDGWVQLTKKEKRVKKPKMEIRYVPSVLSLDFKSDDNSKVNELAKTNDEISKDIPATTKKQSPVKDKKQSSAKDKKQSPSMGKNQSPVKDKKQSPATDKKQSPATDKKESPVADKKQTKKEAEIKSDATKLASSPNVENPMIQNVVVEVPKPENVNLDKHPKDIATDSPKVSEEGKKPKKKKKKNNKEVIQDSTSEPENVSVMSAAQVISEISASEEINKPVVVVENLTAVADKVEMDQQSEVKNSNVAFDELEGLYPEAKQQKKKKKARRDH